jgi:HEAT repeat protein
MKYSRLITNVSFAFLLGCGGQWVVAPTPSHADASTPGVIQTLIDLLNQQDKIKAVSTENPDTIIDNNSPLGQIRSLVTPAGYRIKLRYSNFGIALVEALKVAQDPELRRRLIEEVQWSRNEQVKAEALLVLSSYSKPEDKKYFKEALFDSKVSIRFAAVEALQNWGQPEAVTLLKIAVDRDWSPLMQVFAAQALLSIGEESAIQMLWKLLDHESWIVRAMSARYLGDYANADDYPRLVSYFNKENRNDFVLAELAIASLKLISKKGEKVYYSPAAKGWRDNSEVKYSIGKDKVIEIEPLIIVPPRLRIPASLQIASKINSELLRIFKDRLNIPLDPIQAQDPVWTSFQTAGTPTGFALILRYTNLSYLLVEALAGTTDPLLRAELIRVVENKSTSAYVRASGLVSLAYSRNENDIFMIQDALRDNSVQVRFGALEAVEVGQFEQLVSIVSAIANNDPSPIFRVYAAHVLAKFGDQTVHNLFLSTINDPDWTTRAMSYWYLGRYGSPDDYTLILSRLGVEQDPFVRAEITLALLRLAPL